MKTNAIAARIVLLASLLLCAVSANADGTGLWYSNKDQAVTNWLVIINYPEACSSVPCTEADIFGSLPANPTKATVCYLTGQAVLDSGDGRAIFAGRVAEGTNFGCFFPGDPNPYGLRDAMRAEIHVIVQTHSAVRSRTSGGRELQVSYVNAECNPDCVDVQFAIHVAANAVDGKSWSDVYWFDTGRPVTKAVSTLFREKHGVRVVTDTRLAALED